MEMALSATEWNQRFASIWTELEQLLDRSSASLAVLLDASGNAVTYSGEDPEFDLSSFASLAVADFLATREMASLLGEAGLRWVVHQGESHGLVLAPLHPQLILAVVFDRRTTLGLVRHQIRKQWPRLEAATSPLTGLLDEQARDAELAGRALETDLIGEGLTQLFGPTA